MLHQEDLDHQDSQSGESTVNTPSQFRKTHLFVYDFRSCLLKSPGRMQKYNYANLSNCDNNKPEVLLRAWALRRTWDISNNVNFQADNMKPFEGGKCSRGRRVIDYLDPGQPALDGGLSHGGGEDDAFPPLPPSLCSLSTGWRAQAQTRPCWCSAARLGAPSSLPHPPSAVSER